MYMKHEFLIENNACEGGYEFARGYETLREAWDNCERGDWMAWYAEKCGVDKRILTLVAGLCAETVIHLMKDKRSVNAVKAAISYGKGKIEYDKLEAATNAANAAWAEVRVGAKLEAAANAAKAAWAAALAAASEAAANAAKAAWAAALAAASEANQKQTAEICRKYLTYKITWK